MDIDISCRVDPSDVCVAEVLLNGIVVDRVPTLLGYMMESGARRCSCCGSFRMSVYNMKIVQDLLEKIVEWNGPPNEKEEEMWFRNAMLRILQMVPNPPDGLEEKWRSAPIESVFEDLRTVIAYWHFVNVNKEAALFLGVKCLRVFNRKSPGPTQFLKNVVSYFASGKDVREETMDRLRMHGLRILTSV